MTRRADLSRRAPLPRRVWVALVAVLTLLGAGLPSAAHAAGDSTITGVVQLPEGMDGSSVTIFASYLHTSGSWWSAGFHRPEPDGTFAITGLDAGVGYRLNVRVNELSHVGGHYGGPDKPLQRDPEHALTIEAPFAGVTFGLLEAVELTGTFSTPPGFSWDKPIFLDPWHVAPDGSGSRVRELYGVELGAGAGGKFTIRGLRPDAAYAIRVMDTFLSAGSRFEHGYYRAGVDGVVENFEHATLVRGGDSFHVTFGWTNVLPKPDQVEAPAVSGTPVVGGTLQASAGTWAPADVTVDYAWLRDGAVIAGATGERYTATAADAGARLSVRVTAARAGFAARSVTSAPTAAVAKGAAPRASTAPQLKGTARFGSTVRVLAPSWDPPGVETRFQWLRGGKPIKGATSARYTLKKKDVGKRISVRATATRPGYVDGVAASSSKKVAKGKPKVTVKAKKVKAGKRAKVVVKVKAAGLAKPRGTVIVKYGKKKIRVKLVAKRKGKVTVRLPQLAKGRYKVAATFKPTAKTKKFLTKASSKKVTLRVR